MRAVIAALVCLAAAGVGGEVIELTPADLDTRLAQGAWLLEFYAPWCGYCKRLEPVYEEVAQTLAEQELGVHVARIDSSKYKSVGLRFGINGFPTIVHVSNQDVRRYEGQRSKDALVHFATEGWKSYNLEMSAPLGFSPFSTGAKVIGKLVDGIVLLQDGYDYLREKYNFSHPVLLGLTALGAILIGSVLGTILSVIFPPPAKKPAAKAD